MAKMWLKKEKNSKKISLNGQKYHQKWLKVASKGYEKMRISF